jgi:hypothetical protein
MFFKFKSSPDITRQPVVCYMKNEGGKQFDRDLAVLDAARAQFTNKFILRTENNGSATLGAILGFADKGWVSVVIIPDFSHLGFSKGDLSSALADLFSLLLSGVHLISVRDGFDSKRETHRDAVDMLIERMKEQAA